MRALEAELAAFCGARHAIGCASGTDALLLVLMAWGIGPGDAVICPAFTFYATAEVVALCGATPVMADVDADTFNLDPASCERAIATAKRARAQAARGHPGRSVRPAGRSRCHCRDRRRRTACSCSTMRRSRSARPIAAASSARSATATATSFFPAKPLGCYGDGGAVFTDDDALAARVKSLRVHGESRRQIRCAAYRPHRPARHHPGGGADREAEDFPGRDRGAQRGRGALRRGPRRCRDHAARRQQIDLGLGAVHHPARARAAATRSRPR